MYLKHASLPWDANSKLGHVVIKGDPKEQFKNGKLLAKVINNNDLIEVNGSELCVVTITRQRKTVLRDEKSVLDYFIVCKNFFKLIKKMKVDKEKKFIFCSYSKRQGILNIKESDHN